MSETGQLSPKFLPFPQATPPADGNADATPLIYIIRYISAPNPAPLCMAEEKMGIEGLGVNVFL